jgi:choline-sulfatase
MPRRPNVLILLPDQQSVHALGCYGNQQVATPAADLLARQGVTLDTCYCNAPLCVPSRMSLLSGKHPHRLDAWDNRSILDPAERTFARHLAASGYLTCAIGKMHFNGQEQRYGFELRPYGDLCGWSHQPDPISSAYGLSRIAAGPAEIPEEKLQETIVTEEAIAFLRQHDRSRPFLLVLGYNRPHFPFRPPARYWERYYPDGYDLPHIPPGHLDRLHPWVRAIRERHGDTVLTEDQVARARAGYYGCVTFVDDKIGEVLSALERLGYTEDTIVIYTSDHGEMAGEHDMWGKRVYYEASARVPFIVRWPGRLPAGTRVAEPVELVDLYPTLCDFAGVPLPKGLDGSSLLPLLAGEVKGWRGYAVCDATAWMPAPARMVRKGDWKLNYYVGAGFELFNLREDPEEFVDRSGDHAVTPIVSELAELLARGGWHPGPVEAAWRRYLRSGPRWPRRRLRTPNQYWDGGEPYRDAEDFYPADVDWEHLPIRP